MIKKLIKKLIQVDINKRIEWEEYFNDEFFKNNYKIEIENLKKSLEKFNLIIQEKHDNRGEYRSCK